MAELILEILEELKKIEFNKFKWYLSRNLLKGCKPIPRGQLQVKYKTDVVTKMEDYYGDKMVNITQEILKKIRRDDLINRLEKSQETKCTRPALELQAVMSVLRGSTELWTLALRPSRKGDRSGLHSFT
ncbi:hypothetical protein AAFF_G00289480 [Aldrovandia affinis]|uniref:Pyrin domain-containing protein n=1 Tax=Aldrovandia affinis TaxID=143900 RepID=A0AAD7R9P4_9TELE|nr:hypothetical protein AAFF_G00289480 [Aldrovandia affinis]